MRIATSCKWLLLVLGASLLASCTTMQLGQDDFLYPDSDVDTAARANGQTVERFTVDAGAASIAVTRISQPGNRTVVLYCGGNQFRTSVFGGDIVEGLPEDVDLVVFDYPGYGDSRGETSIDTLMAAGLAVYDQVLMADRALEQRHVVYGMSLGGFVAAHVAGARDPELLILEATAPDAAHWADSMTPWFAKPFVEIEFDPELAAVDSVRALQNYSGRALLLVGSRDSQTTPALMREMGQALREQGVEVDLEVIAGRRHGGVLSHPRAQQAIADFLHAPVG